MIDDVPTATGPGVPLNQSGFLRLLVVAALVALMIYGGVIWDRALKERTQRRLDSVEPAKQLFGILLPPEEFQPVPYDKLSQRQFNRKQSVVEIEQRFEVQGRFSDLKAAYERRIFSEGWKIFDPANSNIRSIEYCRPPWMLRLQQEADFEALAKPHHRVGVNLKWRDGFTNERCPLTRPFFADETAR